MPATITHTIGTDGGLRDYTSFGSWESAQQRDLVAADEIEVGECYDDGLLTDRVTISGWTTDDTRCIKIVAPEGQRHDGTEFSGFTWRNNASNTALIINVPNVEIEGIVLIVNSPPKRSAIDISASTGSGWIKIHHCVIAWGSSGSREDKGILLSAAPAGMLTYIWNTAIYGYTFGIQITPTNRTVYLYNNSLYNNTIGIYLPNGSSQVIAKNCSSLENPNGDFRESASFDGASNYNASTLSGASPYKAPGANSIEGIAGSDNYVSTTNDSEDLHVKDVDAGIYDAGTDLSGDGNLAVSDDYEYESRSVTFSIGADEPSFAITNTTTFDIDTIVQDTLDSILDFDILISDENFATFDMDVAIFATETLTFDMDAHIDSLSTFLMDTVILVEDVEVTFSIDTIISGTIVEHSAGIDGAVRDYTLLSSWEAAQQRDLVAIDEVAQVVCYDDGIMDDIFVIAGWTTDELRYIKVHVPDSARSYGEDLTLTDTQGFFYRSTNRNVTINVSNVWIDGLKTTSSSTGSAGNNIYVDITSGVSGFVKISNCYSVRVDGSTGITRAISITNVVAGSKVYLWNNMGHSRDGTQDGIGIGINAIADMQIVIAHNSYAWKQTGVLVTGIQPSALAIVNNVCLQCSVKCFNLGLLSATYASNNASSDTTAPGGNELHNLVPADNFKNLSSGNPYRDLRIKDADADIYLVATKYPLTGEYEDIFSELRDFVGFSQSIGADEHLKAFFDMDCIITVVSDIDQQVNIYNSLSLADIDQQVNIYNSSSIADIDHLVAVQLVVPSLTFLVRKPGISTLDYSARVMSVGQVVRKLEWDVGVSQIVKANVEVKNLDGHLNYFSTGGDYYPDTRFIWAYAGLKTGWGKNLDQDSRWIFVGLTETLDLIEARKGNYVLTDRLRDALDDETSAAITFNAAYVAAQPNLDSLNPVHIVKHILRDLLAVKIWDFDLDTEVDAVNDTTIDESFDVVADVTVDDTTWPSGTKYIEMIQGCLLLVGGWLYTNGDGKFDLKVFNPFDLTTVPASFIGDETDTTNSIVFKSRLNATRREIINRIQWTYGQAGTDYGPFDDTTSTGKFGVIKKDLTTKWEVDTVLLDSVTERILSRLSNVPKYAVIETDNLKTGTGFNAELGDIISLTDPAQGISSKSFQIIEKDEAPLDRRTRIIAQDIEGLDAKFAMACSEIDESDGLGVTADDFDNWQEGFGFAGNADTGTIHDDGSDPGFDLDGNANGVMETDIAPLDSRGKSIELIFVAW